MSAPTPHQPYPLRPDQILVVRPVVEFAHLRDDRWRVRIGAEHNDLSGRNTQDVLPRVLGAIDGIRDVDALAVALERESGTAPTLTRACLQRLYDWGFLDDAAGYRGLGEGGEATAVTAQELYFALWSSEPRRMQRELGATRVAVVGDGEGPVVLCQTLTQSGIRVAEPGAADSIDLCVGWGASMRDRRLVELNRECAERSRALLVVTQKKRYARLGPLVRPGRSACLVCAIDHFGLEEGAAEFEDASGPEIQIVAQLAALEVIRFAAPCLHAAYSGKQVQIAGTALELREVEILRRPRCRTCGVLTGHSRPCRSSRGKGDPMDEWNAALGAAESMVGWGGSIRMVEAARLAGSIDLITCATRPPRGLELVGGADVPGGSGVGLRWEDALVSTVGESIERLAMAPDPAAQRGWVEAAFSALDRSAVDPERLNYFRPAAYGTPGFPLRRFSPDEVLPWCRGWSLSEGREALLPAEIVYFSYEGLANHHWHCTTSGVASHRSRELALVSALCELVERDAFVAAWLRGEALPSIAPAAFGDAEIDEIVARAARVGVCLHLRDLTGAIGLPSYLAIAETEHGGEPAFGLGAATRTRATTAARKALLESAHTWNWAYLKIDGRGRLDPREALGDAPLEAFGDHVYLYAHSWMKPRAAFLFESAGDAPPRYRDPGRPLPPIEELAQVRHQIESAGFEIFVVDQTPEAAAERGYVVLRAVVPGLLPLQPGWRIQALSSPRLPAVVNPEPHPFP